MKTQTTIEELRQATWEEVENEVVEKLRALHELVDRMDCNEKNLELANQAVLPLMKLIGQFCTSIKLDNEIIMLRFRHHQGAKVEQN